MSEQPVQHYVDKAATGLAKAAQATDVAVVAFWVGSAQVAATLALMEAIREFREGIAVCPHGNVGICMSCVQDGMMGLR